MKISTRAVDIFGFFFDPRVPVLFLVGALVTAVIGNAAYELVVDLIGEKTRGWLAGIMIGGVLILIFIVLLLRVLAQIFVRRTNATIGGSQAFSVRRKGILFTVGKQSDTIELCLRHQAPEFVGFLCSEESEGYADGLISAFRFDPGHCEKRLADPWNINDVRVKSRELLAWLLEKPASSNEIVFDITGGLTTLSLGCFMIAEEKRVDSQYVRSDYDHNGKRIPGTEEAIFISHYGPVS